MTSKPISRVHPSPDTLHQVLAGEAVLLNVRTDHFYALNPVATRLWELIVQNGEFEPIIAALCAEYDAPEAHIREDVLKTVEQLAQLEMIKLE